MWYWCQKGWPRVIGVLSVVAFVWGSVLGIVGTVLLFVVVFGHPVYPKSLDIIVPACMSAGAVLAFPLVAMCLCCWNGFEEPERPQSQEDRATSEAVNDVCECLWWLYVCSLLSDRASR